MHRRENESGQSIIIIAFTVMILLALIALVVDVGNAYAHRRIVQNAVDAAAMAGVRRLAERGVEGQAVLEIQVLNDVQQFAEDNGLDRNAVQAWFINLAGDRLETIDPWLGPVPDDAEGVEVEGDLPFDTYFAHLLGFQTMTATADANGWALTGPCDGGNLFPITLSEATFGGDGPQPGEVYSLWEHDDMLAPGNFGWLYWEDGDGVNRCPYEDCQQSSSVNNSLAPNIGDTSRSGFWSVGDWVHGDTGVNFQPILNEISPYVQGTADDPWPTILIPIYDDVAGQGTNTLFQISGFGAFKMRCALSTSKKYVERVPGDCEPCGAEVVSDDKCVRGEFVKMVWNNSEDGCLDTGVVIPSFRASKNRWKFNQNQ